MLKKDTAFAYGNECEVGDGIEAKIKDFVFINIKIPQLMNHMQHILCAVLYSLYMLYLTYVKDGTVKREELYIVTKLWNTWHAAEDVAKNCEMSLKNLKVDQLGKYSVFPNVSHVL